MNRHRNGFSFFVLTVAIITLAACDGIPVTPSTGLQVPLATQANTPCETCTQATLAAVLTQDKSNAENQAAATAAVVRANAQATLSSANATLSVAQTQEQSNANVIAAQIASTAEMERANAQATLNSAGATQSAALTQDSIQQTQMANLATTSAEALAIQQNKDKLAASTQTAVADNIATQTQAAVATSQWYSDQERQREEQRQGPIAFLWMWCFPTILLLFAGLVLWGFWRWFKNRQANRFLLENPVDRLPESTIDIVQHQHGDSLPYLEGAVIDDRYQHVEPDEQVRQWLDEVKRKLLKRDKEDEENESDN